MASPSTSAPPTSTSNDLSRLDLRSSCFASLFGEDNMNITPNKLMGLACDDTLAPSLNSPTSSGGGVNSSSDSFLITVVTSTRQVADDNTCLPVPTANALPVTVASVGGGGSNIRPITSPPVGKGRYSGSITLSARASAQVPPPNGTATIATATATSVIDGQGDETRLDQSLLAVRLQSPDEANGPHDGILSLPLVDQPNSWPPGYLRPRSASLAIPPGMGLLEPLPPPLPSSRRSTIANLSEALASTSSPSMHPSPHRLAQSPGKTNSSPSLATLSRYPSASPRLPQIGHQDQPFTGHQSQRSPFSVHPPQQMSTSHHYSGHAQPSSRYAFPQQPGQHQPQFHQQQHRHHPYQATTDDIDEPRTNSNQTRGTPQYDCRMAPDSPMIDNWGHHTSQQAPAPPGVIYTASNGDGMPTNDMACGPDASSNGSLGDALDPMITQHGEEGQSVDTFASPHELKTEVTDTMYVPSSSSSLSSFMMGRGGTSGSADVAGQSRDGSTSWVTRNATRKLSISTAMMGTHPEIPSSGTASATSAMISANSMLLMDEYHMFSPATALSSDGAASVPPSTPGRPPTPGSLKRILSQPYESDNNVGMDGTDVMMMMMMDGAVSSGSAAGFHMKIDEADSHTLDKITGETAIGSAPFSPSVMSMSGAGELTGEKSGVQLKRQERNRIAARRSREKKKEYVQELEQKVRLLTIRNKELARELKRLRRELGDTRSLMIAPDQRDFSGLSGTLGDYAYVPASYGMVTRSAAHRG